MQIAIGVGEAAEISYFDELLQPGRIQRVQHDDNGAGPERVAAECFLAACACDVVSAGGGDEGKLEPPPADGKARPDAEAEVSRGMRPKREIGSVHGQVEQEMREDCERQDARNGAATTP